MIYTYVMKDGLYINDVFVWSISSSSGLCLYWLFTVTRPQACCTRYAFKCQNVFCWSWDQLCPVCMQGFTTCDQRETQQAGVMMQTLTARLYLENTSHFPLSPITALLTQMCHQMHAESEECCLKFCVYTASLYCACPPPCATVVKMFYRWEGIASSKGSPLPQSHDGTPLRLCPDTTHQILNYFHSHFIHNHRRGCWLCMLIRWF